VIAFLATAVAAGLALRTHEPALAGAHGTASQAQSSAS